MTQNIVHCKTYFIQRDSISIGFFLRYLFSSLSLLSVIPVAAGYDSCPLPGRVAEQRNDRIGIHTKTALPPLTDVSDCCVCTLAAGCGL